MVRLIGACNFFGSGLRKKNLSPGSDDTRSPGAGPGSIELFGTSDVVVKHVLEVKFFENYPFLCYVLFCFFETFYGFYKYVIYLFGIIVGRLHVKSSHFPHYAKSL